MTYPYPKGRAGWRVPIAVALLGSTLALPGLGQAASCTIKPQNPSVSVGGSVNWSATYSGFSKTPEFEWRFRGGDPEKSKRSSQTVRYASAGTFSTELKLKRGDTDTKCQTTVSVGGAGDTEAPTVSISASPAGPTYTSPGSVAINASAADNQGVTKVEFYDGSTLKATDTSVPYSYAWSVSAGENGTHVWTAKAYDAASNVGTSNALGLTVAIGVDPAPNVSINSTSQDSQGEVLAAVPEQPKVVSSSYSVLAVNDLGIHCGDYDTRIASILPPFQVMLAQVIRKGSEPELNPSGVDLFYSAVSNPQDPILGVDAFRGVKGNGSTFKTNFWDTVAKGAYDPFYPAYNPFVGPTAPITPLAGPPFNVGPDVGLPVPNVENLYIGPDGLVNSGDELLSAVQHDMPGKDAPYVANSPQLVREHYADKPFFLDFPFGYVANDVNWYEGVGVPFSTFDDFGREAPYPLVRVQAKQGNTVLTTVDTVLPISGEASCSNCHSDPSDVQESRTSGPTTKLRDAGLPVVTSLDDPDPDLPNKVSVEYAADINILRLHDLKHGANYVSPTGAADHCTINAANPNGTGSCLTNKALVQNKPVVCQVCHYTPALDLAQLGPLAGAPGTIANGRNQVAHKSNSNVMHSHHGQFADLFPQIPAPVQDTNPASPTYGAITNQDARVAALENSCYQCHPGKDTKCLRGAMYDGGMLCSDCHGNMEQVGNDFSKNVQPTVSADGTKGPGKFILAKDFYTNPNTPRVPWANEPGCGSCHTGDATSNLAASSGVIRNLKDTYGNTDNIRLLQAWKTGDAKATSIVPTNKRFAESVIPASFNGFANPGAGNPRLYRMSSGHEGVMCEGCHGATHAEWPNANPNANDNLTASQLQGHTGVIIECSTCHADGLSDYKGLEGPHGLHVVGNTKFANGDHKDAAKSNPNACRACHGSTGQGTVLAKMAVDRTLKCKSEGVFCGGASTKVFPKGKMVRCDDCHKNKLN